MHTHTAGAAGTRGAATCEPTRRPASGQGSEVWLVPQGPAQEHVCRCMCVQGGEGMARCLQMRGCCSAPHLHATPPTAEEPAPAPLPALLLTQTPATHPTDGPHVPKPWEGGMRPPC